MRKLILLVLLCLGGSLSINAQVGGLYSQYMFNGLVINPAYAGSIEDAMSFTAFYRDQWAGVDGAPQDLTLSAHGPFGKNKKVGLGVFLENNREGLTNWYNFFASYSYKFELQNNATLSAGLQGGASLLQANLLEGDAPDGQVFDPALGFESAWRPNFGAGLYYYSDRLYIGVSVPYILEQRSIRDKDGVEISLNQGARTRQYLLTGGYVFPINDNLKLKPSALLRVFQGGYDPVVADLSASLFIREAFSLGITYRTGAEIGAVVFMLGYRAPNGLRVGYAYDNSFDDISRYTSSHEVLIGFDLSRSDKGVLSPRYF